MKKGAIKTVTMTVRFTENELARIKRACSRDELKPTVFAYESVMSSLNELIHKQETVGYKCQQAL